jgi:hypothetical protein
MNTQIKSHNLNPSKFNYFLNLIYSYITMIFIF